MNMEERAARGFEMCLPSMILNNAEPQKVEKRRNERGNEGEIKSIRNTMLFMDPRHAV